MLYLLQIFGVLLDLFVFLLSALIAANSCLRFVALVAGQERISRPTPAAFAALFRGGFGVCHGV
jgi:hypothetical protein